MGFPGCKKQPVPPAEYVEITDIQRRSAVVAWQTESPVQGRVHYRSASGSGAVITARENLSRSYRHRVRLPNLEPGSRYTYWIDNPDHRFQFQTQPENNTPFSFLLFSGLGAKKIGQAIMTEIPDFIVDLVPLPGLPDDPYKRIRPFVPVFGPRGISSRSADPETGRPGVKPSWTIHWGGMQLMVIHDLNAVESLDFTAHARISGILLPDSGVPMEMPGKQGGDPLEQSLLYRKISAYNRAHPDRPVSFAVVPSTGRWHAMSGKVAFFGMDRPSAVRIDIHTHSAYAVVVETGEKFVLKDLPVKEKMTCDDCRRLADKGAYMAAVDAYTAFIKNNTGHFQIDDAYFAVSLLYDEKLFDFPSATAWYEKLIRQYPSSSFTPLARQRIAYLTARSDFDFKPLARFEKIKKTEYPRTVNRPAQRRAALASVAAILDDYPGAVIAPQVLNWLAHQYKTIDLDRSVALFKQVSGQYPGSAAAKDAWLNIGDTYYQAKQYKKARHAYETALEKAEGNSQTLWAQIRRCNRNLIRGRLAFVSMFLLGGFSCGCLCLRPVGVTMDLVKRGLIAGMLVLTANTLFAWLIREQFLSRPEMVFLIAGFTLSAAWAGIAGASVAGKLRSRLARAPAGNMVPVTAGMFSGLLMMASGFYLSIFYINEHYLIILKL